MNPEIKADPFFILGQIRATLESDRAPRQKTEAIGKILSEWEEAKLVLRGLGKSIYIGVAK